MSLQCNAVLTVSKIFIIYISNCAQARKKIIMKYFYFKHKKRSVNMYIDKIKMSKYQFYFDIRA